MVHRKALKNDDRSEVIERSIVGSGFTYLVLCQDCPASETGGHLTHAHKRVKQQTEEECPSAPKDAVGGLREHVEE